MRFVKTPLGLQVPVSNEESALLEKFKSFDGRSSTADDLNPREAQLAEMLTKRGVLSIDDSVQPKYTYERNEYGRIR